MHGQRTGLYGGHVYAQSEAIAGIAGNVAQRSDAGFQPNCNSMGLSSMLNQSGLYYSRPRWDGDGSNKPRRFAHPTHAPSIQYQAYYHWVCPLFIYRIAYAITPFWLFFPRSVNRWRNGQDNPTREIINQWDLSVPVIQLTRSGWRAQTAWDCVRLWESAICWDIMS